MKILSHRLPNIVWIFGNFKHFKHFRPKPAFGTLLALANHRGNVSWSLTG